METFLLGFSDQIRHKEELPLGMAGDLRCQFLEDELYLVTKAAG